MNLTGTITDVEGDGEERLLLVEITGSGCRGVLRVPVQLLRARVGDEVQIQIEVTR